MGKMIAVCGSPNCGKTTAALKLAQEIYGLKKSSVMFLSPDLIVWLTNILKLSVAVIANHCNRMGIYVMCFISPFREILRRRTRRNAWQRSFAVPFSDRT